MAPPDTRGVGEMVPQSANYQVDKRTFNNRAKKALSICNRRSIPSFLMSRDRKATSAIYLGFLREGEPLDGDEGVGFGVSDDDPPSLLALLRVERGDDWPRHFVFSL